MPEALTSAEVQAAFGERMEPFRITLAYRIRLLTVIFGLIALQLLYLALVACVLYLTYEYVVLILAARPAFNAITIVIYLGPPLAGVIATLFLLKPILARPKRPPEPLRLTPENEPALFEFVDRLCRTLGSPKPSRINVDLQANASAAVHGWRGFFFGDLTLTIGLPLAKDFTLRQFAGVLGHEFGHFAQRAGLRSFFLIQSIQRWFARVVHERDGWDEWLETHTQKGDWRLRAVAFIASMAVTVSRKYLALLMKAGGWISCAFSRQMEFDADRYEAAIVGMEVFEQTLRRLPLLSVGSQLAWQDARRDFALGRLPEDIASLNSIRASLLPETTAAKVVEEVGGKTTGRFDSHPCMMDRIQHVRRFKTNGIFALEGGAARLFSDLPRLCCDATRHHYRTVLGVPEASIRFVPAEEIVGVLRSGAQFDEAAQSLFGLPAAACIEWLRLRPVATQEPNGAAEDEATTDEVEGYEAAVRRHQLHFAALMLVQAGVKVNPPSFELSSADLMTIQSAEERSRRQLHMCIERMRDAAKPVVEGLAAKVSGLCTGGYTVTVPQGFPVPNLAAAWQCYDALSQCQSQLAHIRDLVFATQIVRGNGRLIHAAKCANLIDKLEGQSRGLIQQIIAQMTVSPVSILIDSRLPPTVGGQLTVSSGSQTERIATFLARTDSLSARTLGHLAWMVKNAVAKTDRPDGAEG
jgi:Zn-dependent protease with chaperone function